MTAQSPAGAGAEKVFVLDLPEGHTVRTYFLCSEREIATTRAGKPFLRLKLRDASGEVKAIHFEPSDEVLARLASGDVVKVEGIYTSNGQYGQQFKIDRLRLMEPGEYDPATLIPVSPVDLGQLTARLETLIASVAHPALHALLERALDPQREPGAAFAVAPAAVRNHHAYRHGLLEHSIVVAEVAAGVAANFAAVNRELVVTGALLHDIGKTRSYSTDMMAPGFTDAGRLHGEIVIGHDMVRDLMAEQPDFPAEIDGQLRHIIVSHHGEREKGSPVVPMTREAVIVHFCDDMTARVAACDDAEREAVPGERWSGFSRMLETFVYLGPRDGEPQSFADEEPVRDGTDSGDGDEQPQPYAPPLDLQD
jgi:3'-5' exoribonuclease